ncbi:MAG: hypothetical protein LBS10_01825, partial [Gracilibacteraceae bacterium]|nr:hypothetical protein [Gracilibacteraceae bacterium]
MAIRPLVFGIRGVRDAVGVGGVPYGNTARRIRDDCHRPPGRATQDIVGADGNPPVGFRDPG